jgi:hypothetical protein
MECRRALPAFLLFLFAAAAADASSCTLAGSMVPNCGFDTDDSWWSFSADQVTWVSADCATGPGCLEIDRHDAVSAAEALSSCAPVVPGAEYGFGGSFRLESGAITQTCGVGLWLHSDAGCLTFLTPWFATFAITPAWREQVAGATMPGDAHSVILRLVCYSESEFVMRIDDALVVAAVFVDGFESEDSTRWSATVP